jgi:FKBP-type peptidyl-prolyl cis-trans isomerase FklB
MMAKWTVLAAVGLMGMQVAAEEPGDLKTQKDKVSYSIGVDIGKNFKRQGLELDLDKMSKGLKDGMAGGKLAMTEDEMRATMMSFQNEMLQKQDQAAAAKGADNKKEGEAFLAKNKADKDVVTLPSGLQYKIVKAGEGKKPVDTDTVKCHYKGTLINGTEFDSSYRRGAPATFQVGQVIKGWQEALKLMPVGSKWQLVIPSDLAYGARGAGNDIGPNATLIFEVELLAIK